MMRKLGERLEGAAGLHPHPPTAAGPATASMPEWATSERYPGSGILGQPSLYPPEDAVEPLPAAPAKESPSSAAGGKHHVDLSKMSPRAQAIAAEVGRELEESTSLIT